MIRPGITARRILLAGLLAWPLVTASSARTTEATVYRDTWGVPHIYAGSQEAAAYAHGYVQAEDRLEDVCMAYLTALGKSARVLGEAGIEQDFQARAARHAELARTRYAELGQETRRLIESYVAGLRAYMIEHPQEVPAWAETPEPQHVVALYRAFIWRWPLGQLLRDLRGSGAEGAVDSGSNEWVVGPSRSTEGAPIALIDPHLSWEPLHLLYEAHVHGGRLDFYGFSVIGTPLAAVGHTDVFSLACTTGGPDCADVYEVRIHPEDPLQYEHDGRWRPVQVEELAIEVKTPAGLRTETRRIERTHHGPILRRAGRLAYAGRTTYDDEIGIVEQWLRMLKSRNLGEFLNALRANQSFPQNLMYADIYGNAYYLRAGRVPVRPAGQRWDQPVPGWTSDTEWRGLHPLADLVQLLNPAAGYMQNCNVSPDSMLPASPLTGDRYPVEIFNSPAQRSNSRGRRLLELLGSKPRLGLDDALEIAVDTQVDRAGHWQRALAGAFASKQERHAHLGPAVELLLGWNGRMDLDSRAAALYRYWMRACRAPGTALTREAADAIEEGKTGDAASGLALLDALGAAVGEMQARIGRIDVAWGDVHRAERGERSWPVAGCRADGISTLRSVRSSEPDARGVFRAEGGQLCTTVVLLREQGVVSFSATPFGQSGRKGSAHYSDQGQRLFSRSRLKPTWYGKAELLRNLESQRTLTLPEPPPSGVEAR